MSTPLVALILGAGPRIGTTVATHFLNNGYAVALASRSGTNTKTTEGFLSLQADFTDPSTLPALFNSVKETFNAAPSTVIYNAASLTRPPDADSALSIPVENFTSDLNVNTVSPYAAAQLAIQGWETLPAETKKTFIYTGNGLNQIIHPVPAMLTLGTGKSAAAYWLGLADRSYAGRGYRFFYADERAPDGNVKGPNVDAPAHAEFYAQLAAHEGNLPWNATFVSGKGYVKFG
ncbi:hypothetical protein BJX76DRAFT_102806 [Aspergillus varians]